MQQQGEDWPRFDRAVLETPGLLPFVSSQAWILSAHEHLHPEARVITLREGESGCFSAFAQGPLYELGEVHQPLEAAWCFACPVVGASLSGRWELLMQALSETTAPLLLLGGMSVDDPLYLRLRQKLPRQYLPRTFPGVDCVQASLAEGMEGFLSRRKAKFRASLRRSERLCTAAHIHFEWLGQPDPAVLLRRILKIEEQSWKHEAGESIFQSPQHQEFYEAVLGRTGQSEGLRAVIAQQEGRDVGYIFGAVLGPTYRGLQMSYDDAFRDLGLGNALQAQMVQGLCAEEVLVYDLGMDIDYKRRWAERLVNLVNVLIWKT